jgi:hypothetical protein
MEISYAKLFDYHRIPWRYEPHTFKFGGAGYKPDFVLGGRCWVEIKPIRPKAVEVLKAALLSAIQPMPVVVCVGYPGSSAEMYRYEGGFLREKAPCLSGLLDVLGLG